MILLRGESNQATFLCLRILYVLPWFARNTMNWSLPMSFTSFFLLSFDMQLPAFSGHWDFMPTRSLPFLDTPVCILGLGMAGSSQKISTTSKFLSVLSPLSAPIHPLLFPTNQAPSKHSSLRTPNIESHTL